MFKWFKKKKEKRDSEILKTDTKEPSSIWYEVGDKDNPFNKKVLDVSDYTRNTMAFTKSKAIALKFNELRNSIGKELIDFDTSEFDQVSTNLEYPHNGKQLEGIAFKADSMDCKWDIYAYNDYLFFSRSWDGILIYKAKFSISENSLVISEIRFDNMFTGTEAENDVHFLINSHAMNQAFPHMIPKELTSESEIEQWSFVKFGNRAYYATYDSVVDARYTAQWLSEN
ncbi:hypothetical protein POV27_07340 [Aureisphaera galaxeae]|uniref:hypothetical protein n=1 Tax=Aureisphaera galaxeae TaxID=1538023 RepID=UPI002350F0C6|nr:hypothetical protein [Aureisphaera galaxeae]MDC8003860.1 hypothetical protein [Aureisphaera galaxeae]